MPTPQFAVDKMLGRLATWLRIIGYDATYGSHLGGRTLVRHARAQERIILTRDRRLLRERPCPPLLLIESDHFRAQLRQVIDAYQLDPFAQLFARCARCNLPLSAIAKEEVADRVPPYVAATQMQFVRCPRCGRLYWPATHVERVRLELEGLGFRPPPSSDHSPTGAP